MEPNELTTPEEIIQAYDNAANILNEYTAQEAAKIGNSQRGLGTLAERVASPSGQTSGLANYTYNRTLRPTVDSLAASLTTTGKAQALENKLNAELRAAKNRYEDAKNAYTVASTTPSSTGGSGSGSSRDIDFGAEVNQKDESSSEGEASSTATQSQKNLNAAIDTLNSYAAVTGGGQLQSIPTGTKFSYTLNGSKHEGYVYSGQGGEIDGMSFTKDGLRNYLDNKVRSGASFQNYLGNDTNYSIWKMQFKIH